MNKYILLLFTILHTLHIASAQQSIYNANIIPPSPTSSEFDKYVKQEVSYYNGMPEISIPLYTINLKDQSIPINLSYHASGIKYHQKNGSVGVGWVLNPGYRISRTIRGYADELVSMPTDFSTVLLNYENQINLDNDPQLKVNRDRYLSKFVRESDLSNYGQLDGEFDEFVFSSPGGSGEFIIQDRVNGIVQTLEESNLQIDYVTGNSLTSLLQGSITGIQVTDDRGNRYAYGEYDTLSQNFTEAASNYYGGFVATAWGIHKITTPTGEKVNFDYVLRDDPAYTYNIRNFSVRETNDYNCDLQTVTSEPGGSIYNSNGYNTFFCKKIVAPDEEIIFTYNNESGGNPLYANQLWKIQINSRSGESIKTIKFFYTDDSNHIFLDHVTIYDSEQNAVKTYSFDYYSKDISTNFTFDHYGYYLESTSPELFFHSEFSDDPILVSDPAYGNCQNRTMDIYMSGTTTSREPKSYKAPDYFSLKRITYPTGGSSEYVYESGKYMPVGGGQVRNAGIRIQKITSSDNINTEALVRSYTYGEEENGCGYPMAWVQNMESLFVKEMIEMNFNLPFSGVARIVNYSTSMLGDIGSIFGQPGFIKYPCVSEYYSSSSSSPSQNGKTTYYYNVGNSVEIGTLSNRNIIPREVYNGSPSYITKYRPWDKPRLERKVSYSFSNGSFTTIREEKYLYNQISHTYKGLKVEQSANKNINSNIDIYSYDIVLPEYTLDRYFNYSTYTVQSGKNILAGKEVYDIYEDGTIISVYDYDYSDFLLSEETFNDSKGRSIKINYRYPKDINTGVYASMANLHMLNYPVEKTNLVDNKVVGSTLTTYKSNYGGYVPDKIYSVEMNSPLTTFTAFNGSTMDSHYNSSNPEAKFEYYDSKGNPTQITSRDGTTTSYLWDATDNYLMAKVQGATYSQVSSQDGKTYSYSSKTLYNSLKSVAPAAMIITYSHKPLIGITEQTDPNGVTTYYEYDAFGRLDQIKNADGEIVEQYDYHYAGEDGGTGVPSTLSVNTSQLTFDAIPLSQTVTVSSNTSWTATTTDSWITTITPSSGTGNGSILIKPLKIVSGPGRTGQITLATTDGTQTVTIGVTQDGAIFPE
ncbi:hypothetical protein [Draconibacterium mangrovi]|uniref:hypothetical protein n=1 Tax=Draconibacterium mangrovi TaxID=2697469 RepID=UPI0013D6D7D3|nr:hypothetical protein [Draconibacterium mangrovi]